MDLPNTELALSPAHNVEVITIQSQLFMSCTREWNFNRFADFGLWIAQKCIWQQGSARTCWWAI